MKRISVFLLILSLLALAPPALAHALLVHSSPEANATLAQAPALVELWLTEAVEPAFTEIKVLDTAGGRVDDGMTRVDADDPTHVTIGLRSLGDGVYTVSWKVLSAVDGHVTQGAFPFAVGNVDAAALAAAGVASAQTSGANPAEVLPRWLTILGAALIIGGYMFSAYVWRISNLKSLSLHLYSPLPLQHIGLALCLAGSLASLLWQAALAGGSNFLLVFLGSALSDLLFGSRYGLLWLSRVLFVLALIVWQPERKTVARPSEARSVSFRASVFFSAALLLILSLNSHAAAYGGTGLWKYPVVPVIGNWLHLLAACVWIGGLAHFAYGLHTARALTPADRTHLAAYLVPRFSNVGLTVVSLLALTGLYNASVTLGSFGALFDSDYGRGLLTKLWIIVPLVGLAGINLLILRPALNAERDSGSPGGRMSRHLTLTVGGELVLGAAVLYAASSFATLPPARAPVTGLALRGRADDVRFNVAITPGVVGVNRFDLEVIGEDGRPVTDALEALLRFTPASGELAPSEIALTNQANGHYIAQGSYLSLAGDWQVQVVVRRMAKYDAFANFEVRLAPPSTAPDSGGTPRIAALILYGIALVFVFAVRALVKPTGFQNLSGLKPSALLTLAGIFPAAALLIAGVFVFRGAATVAVPAQRVNPIAPSQASLAQGQTLYRQYCLPCHGAAGLGDGPAGLQLNPRPSNLQIHMAPGVHTDGQIFEWITNGYPNSPMPAFGQTLTEEQRWHVLNYIRTLVPSAEATTVAVVPTATPAPTQAAAPGLEGKLIFTQGLDGLWQIDLSTGVETQLWKLPERGYLAGVAASPDGAQLALAYSAPPPEGAPQFGSTDIYLSSPDASNLQRLVARTGQFESYVNPAWSPEGAWVYFTHYKPIYDDQNNFVSVLLNVERVSPGGGAPETVVENAEQISFSGDGSRIAFLRFNVDTYSYALWTANADGSNPTELVPDTAFFALVGPRLSPDGATVAFGASGNMQASAGPDFGLLDGLMGVKVAQAHGPPWEVWTIPLTGGEPTQLTQLFTDGPWPAWSPDGKHLAALTPGGVLLLGKGDPVVLGPAQGHGEMVWVR